MPKSKIPSKILLSHAVRIGNPPDPRQRIPRVPGLKRLPERAPQEGSLGHKPHKAQGKLFAKTKDNSLSSKWPFRKGEKRHPQKDQPLCGHRDPVRVESPLSHHSLLSARLALPLGYRPHPHSIPQHLLAQVPFSLLTEPHAPRVQQTRTANTDLIGSWTHPQLI